MSLNTPASQASLGMLAPAEPLFSDFRVRCRGDGGAREMFQELVSDLVNVRHPDLAMDIAGPGGTDWGIDTYIGRLDGGVHVWQSKFFLPFISDQQKQIRDSFKQVMKKAGEEGFLVESWTLCVPCVLPPDQQSWFDRWATKQMRNQPGLVVNLWNGSMLRRLLMAPDAVNVRVSYFESPSPSPAPVEPVSHHPEIGTYRVDALFVKQLHEAGYFETDTARGVYFATDALIRDLTNRGDTESLAALEVLSGEVHFVWEAEFNAAVATGEEERVSLVNRVLEAASGLATIGPSRLQSAHHRGLAHRLVEHQRAGWVDHWRDVATAHGTTDPATFMDPDDD